MWPVGGSYAHEDLQALLPYLMIVDLSFSKSEPSNYIKLLPTIFLVKSKLINHAFLT